MERFHGAGSVVRFVLGDVAGFGIVKIGIVVQARLSSQRFPRKVLHPVAGKPMLQYTLERLQRCRETDGLLLATSDSTDDAEVAEFCQSLGVDCLRGPLENVAERFRLAVDQGGLDAFVRISGDSPLLDSELVDRAVKLFRESECDLITNVMPRSFPPGHSVEVVDAGAFRSALREMSEPEDFEHVTKFLYKNPDRYRIRNFESGTSYPGVHMAVDTAEHMARFAAIVAAMRRPHYEYGLDEVVALYYATSPSEPAAA